MNEYKDDMRIRITIDEGFESEYTYMLMIPKKELKHDDNFDVKIIGKFCNAIDNMYPVIKDWIEKGVSR